MRQTIRVVLALVGLVPWVLPALKAEASLKSPRETFGFEMGADRKLVDWPEIVQYCSALASASDRVRMTELGKTTLGRPFVVVTVSAPENLKRLEDYRSIQQKLADPRGLSPIETRRLIREGKAIVLITCNIHSTEIASSQAAVEFLYELAVGKDEKTLAALRDTILLVVPSLNPDGQQMVVEWYRKYLGTPFEACPLPQLYHHYVGHDNNRDWYMFTQVETQLTVSQLHNVWHPQIVYDLHQMGPYTARIFVPPWMDPVDPNIDPILQEMTLVIGGSMASDLTAAGKKGVVVNAIYDLWNPSRHYQNYHGGIRILSETASCRIASPISVRFGELEQARGYDARRQSWNHPDPWPGGDWHLRDIVDYQLITLWSCISTAGRERDRLLRNFYLVGKRAVERKDYYAFVVPKDQKDPANAAKLLEILKFGMVDIHEAKAAFTAGGRSYDAGTRVILLAQPYSAWVKTLLERQKYPTLLEYPGGPLRRPYDVTAQTLPLLMGVTVDLVKEPFQVPMTLLEKIAPQPGAVYGKPGEPGYVLSYDTTQASLGLNRLLKKGFRAFWLTAPLQVQGGRLESGSIYVPSAPGLDDFMAQLARETSLRIYALEQRPAVPAMELSPPRIGLYQSYVPSMDEGWTRWLLEQFEFPYGSLHDKDFRAGSLKDRLDVVVISDQSEESIVQGWRQSSGRGGERLRMPEEYTGGIGEEGVQSLREFVEAGGTLVTLNGASEFAIHSLQLPVADRLRGASDREFYCPGSLLRVDITTAHPLGFGLRREEAAWVEGGHAFESGDPQVQAPVKYGSAEVLLSGWLQGANLIQGKAAVIEVPRGKGRIILMGFRPQYRGQSYATFPLFFNALYYAAARPAGSTRSQYSITNQ